MAEQEKRPLAFYTAAEKSIIALMQRSQGKTFDELDQGEIDTWIKQAFYSGDIDEMTRADGTVEKRPG